MLFNSPDFIFLFLPFAVVLHFALARWSVDAALIGTALASLFFYAWWNPPFVLLPITSIVLNFGIARAIAGSTDGARRLYISGIVVNILLLGYFKYAGFLLSIVTGTQPPIPDVPLALSFTTFVQIAFLAEVYKRRKVPDTKSYALFVLFFPHLIAGPIVRWSTFGRQLRDQDRYRLNWDNVALGLTIFTFGLVKKVQLADSLSPHVAPVYDAAAAGDPVTAAAAWLSSIAFALQIYYDFSGYSDMAVGLGLLFNYRLPVNFAAPFRSTSEFELWRRWHITLSRFFRDFVYVPLGFGRPRPARRALNLMITMMLAGLWHGANWTFIAWGAYHGLILLINMAYRQIRGPRRAGRVAQFFGWLTTITLFVSSSVFFRAPNIQTSGRLIAAMTGFGEAPPPVAYHLPLGGWDKWMLEKGYVSELFERTWFGTNWSVADSVWTLAVLTIALLVPDTMEIANYRDGDAQASWRREIWTWRPNLVWLVSLGALFVMAYNTMQGVTEFIYYQF
jgi:alginate O-acetyltransferase complex protein AlgI